MNGMSSRGGSTSQIADRANLQQQLSNCSLVLCETARDELLRAARVAGPTESQAVTDLLSSASIVPDNPSQVFSNLTPTRRVGQNDIVIFGTADQLNITIFTTDARFVSGANSQLAAAGEPAVNAVVHPPSPFTGN